MTNFDILKREITECLIRTKSKETIQVLTHLQTLVDGLGDDWISIGDDLPVPEQEINYLDDKFEPKNFYLVQLENGFIDTVYYATIYDGCEYKDIFIICTVKVKDNRYYVQERGFDGYTINEIKYWQPLPKPPKEKTNEPMA